MIRRLDTPPPDVVSKVYHPEHRDEYKWFDFCLPKGEPYARVGLWMNRDEAWMLWTILKPGLAAWRELKRVDRPWFVSSLRVAGVKRVVVGTNDPADKNFDKMVKFMGFYPAKMGFQEL